MSHHLKSCLAKKIMSRFSKGNTTNANTSSRKSKASTTVAETPLTEKDGAPFTLPLSIGPSIQNRLTETDMIPIKRYKDLQNEYQSIVNRYNFMKDEFAEMRVELARLRNEREKAWLKTK